MESIENFNEKETHPNTEQQETGIKNIKPVSREVWKETLPQVHWMAEISFRDFNPQYYMDDKGNHYVIYTEDGELQGRKLYIAAHNAGISAEIDPKEMQKN